jgi:hypothetical protein
LRTALKACKTDHDRACPVATIDNPHRGHLPVRRVRTQSLDRRRADRLRLLSLPARGAPAPPRLQIPQFRPTIESRRVA